MAELNYRATLKCVPEYVNVRCINFCIWINLLTFTSVPIYCNGLCFIKIIEIKKKKKTKCMNRHFSNLRLKRYHHTKIRWRLFWQSLEAISFRKKERRFSKKKKKHRAEKIRGHCPIIPFVTKWVHSQFFLLWPWLEPFFFHQFHSVKVTFKRFFFYSSFLCLIFFFWN